MQRFNQLSTKAQLISSALLGMLLLIGFQWMLQDQDAHQRHLHQYGGMVAEQLTRLSKDAMVREDSIALNVLAEQVAGDPAIGSVTIYSMDGQTLASYGDTDTKSATTHEFNRPIQLADATAGFVRVTLDPSALEPNPESPLLLHWLTRVWRELTSLALAGLCLWGVISWLTQNVSSNPLMSSKQTTTQPAILLAVRLFNSADMSSARRDALMDAAELRIAEVTQLYGGQHLPIESGALAVVFASDGPEDQRFRAACAALAIARLCNQPGGARYRYSLRETALVYAMHSDATPSGSSISSSISQPMSLEPTELSEDVLADSLLYAALASDNTIAVSTAFAQAMERPERLNLTREHSPALGSLQTEVADDYYLLNGANAATEDMLNHQVAALEH